MKFIKKLCGCDMGVISQEELIKYAPLVQEATHKYRNIGDSNRWEPTNIKENSQDQPSLPKSCNMSIDQSINKDLNSF